MTDKVQKRAVGANKTPAKGMVAGKSKKLRGAALPCVETPNPVGRPTLFRPEFCEQARKLCLLGATDEELADFFEVGKTTIYSWKAEYPEFLESIKSGKVHADADVAASLFTRANGYEKGNRHVPGDVTAMIFWLKNRRPDLWRDRVETQIDVSTPSREELDEKYWSIMHAAQERQRAVLIERGLSHDE